MSTESGSIPLQELCQDAAAVVESVRGSDRPLVITDQGRATAVMLSVEAYEKGERERRLLHLLVRGDKEIAAGEGFDLDAVLAEADALLADDRR